uniref:Nuclear receptor domain-containing protein n=1 Tax=Mesocestoides corti TaxID=53468 RepID=A0A5K3ENZ2_MESCO
MVAVCKCLFTDMAGSRSVQSQFMSLSGFSDPQAAAAAAAVKFHLAMTSSTAANSNRLEANNANEAFDPTLHHRLPPPPTQFPSEGAFVPEASSAGPFLDGRLPRPNWQQPIPPTTTLSEVAKPLDVGLLSSRNSAIESGLPRPRQCRYQDFQTLCYHSTCRRAMLKQQRRLLQSEYLPPSLELDRPDEHLFACLTECVQRIREPFAPEEPLDTRAAETLEQEYNRMDVCIRRIIRVVKMLPYFNEIGKPAQLGLLRANVYGMIVLYSSFFFERDIRKLRYPIKRQDGTLSTVTVSMLDDLTPSMGGCIGDKALATSAFLLCKNRQAVATGLREDFELYKANTLAAFNHLDELAGEDDLLRMVLLAVKLFTDDSLSEDLRSAVELSKRAYLVFLWTYLRWRAGPKHLRQATELFARLHLAFIDLRSLEIRMTEFAKLVSLDGLSPLMREICSLRSNSSGRGLVGGAL